ncbi:hypothetical protein [Hydrogenimonas thermophila]|uniref:hypothetical protein n=1 Tax=Hydrogenimonas thermophila TaxID=223786 RepID=UPI0011609002|nr:hypothetical protein [Hydrogenimonas thermophila]
MPEKVLFYSNDIDFVREIFRDKESIVNSCASVLYLSDRIFSTLKDEEWTRRLLEKSIKLSKNSSEKIAIAKRFIQQLNDKEMAKKLYKEAEEIVDGDFKSYYKLANDILFVLEDEKWAKQLYKKTEKYAKNKDDYFLLFKDIEKIDENLCDKLFKKYLESLKTYKDIEEVLSFDIKYFSENKKLLKKVYEKAIELARIDKDRLELLLNIATYFGTSDIELLDKILTKKINNIALLREYALKSIDVSKDKYLAKELFKKALKSIKNKGFKTDDLFEIGRLLDDIIELGDNEFVKEVNILYFIEKLLKKQPDYFHRNSRFSLGGRLFNSIMTNLEDNELAMKVCKLIEDNSIYEWEYSELVIYYLRLDDKEAARRMYEKYKKLI